MKKQLILIGICLTFTVTLLGLAGCNTQTQAADANAITKTAGAPSLQPGNHAGRFERGGANLCYGCHGNGSLANPQITGLTIIPEDHYVDATYDSKKIDPIREQCLSCHPAS